MTQSSALSAREVYQLLKDIALGLRIMQVSALDRADSESRQVHVEGWHLTLHINGNRLQRCEQCRAPDGRAASLEDWQRFGSNPVDLLSKWEHEQLERLLNADRERTDHL